MIQRLVFWTAGLLLASLLPAHSQAAERVEAESGVKAALVYNLLLFVQWPEDKLPSDGSLRLCILASPAMEDAFDKLAGKPIHNRPLSIRHITSAGEESRQCQAVWVEEGRSNALNRLALAARGNGILVLSEGSTALSLGAMIGVSNEGGRMVFTVDNGAAKEARLTVSSKLLRLARGVVDKTHE
ncbi:MAG TPA: YfiR family protein [Rhodocyclaceae bacterium]|nr:YfiR family protein [Rhodocyclaceae bacterium]